MGFATRFNPRRIPPSVVRVFGVVCLGGSILIGSGCAAPQVSVDDPRSFHERAVTKEQGEVRVTAAALSADESVEVFGARLDSTGIQPIWLMVENASSTLYWLFPTSVDNDYFPPNEVARRADLISEGVGRAELTRRLHKLAFPKVVGPSQTVFGFVYTNADEGVKAFNVDLVATAALTSFHFTVRVPGLNTDYPYADSEPACKDGDIKLANEDELRAWLRQLPCCVEDKDGNQGDPVNIAFIGNLKSMRAALIARHWDLTAKIDAASTWTMVTAFVFQDKDRYAPVSNLYLFGRQQDVALQKARNVVSERNHLRLWLAPSCFESQTIWVGQVSRDIAVKLTGKLSPPTTHVIDPDIDDARFYVLQDMYYSEHVRKFGFVTGVGAATMADPKRNGSGDPYHTDGLRAVFVMSGDAVPVAERELLKWVSPITRPH